LSLTRRSRINRALQWRIRVLGLTFNNVTYRIPGGEPLSLDLELLGKTIVGLTGPDFATLASFAQLACGAAKPEDGAVASGPAAIASASFFSFAPAAVSNSIDEALGSDAEVVLIGPSLALTDPLFRERTLSRISERAHSGALVVVASQDLGLLERVADEVIFLENGGIADRGDPGEVLSRYRRRVSESIRAESQGSRLVEYPRRGDERAEVVSLELFGVNGQPTGAVASGEKASIQARVRFKGDVANPVFGILIRNRVGVTVYGTNTELEKMSFGPCSEGDELDLRFDFKCRLCPHEYTLTVASHDPDGTAHDWLEEALVFTVTDSRYTAGFANLKATVEGKLNRN